MSSTFIEQAKWYAAYHQQPITKLTHFIGVPLITFSLMLFFSSFKLSLPGIFIFNLVWPVVLAFIVYYIRLEWRLGVSLAPVLLFLSLLASYTVFWFSAGFSFSLALALFAIGWVFQLVGHCYEKNRPALLDNFFQALIAPLFLTAELFFFFGKLSDLESQLKD
jgi:uncharacterized membrane protein YGL010W